MNLCFVFFLSSSALAAQSGSAPPPSRETVVLGVGSFLAKEKITTAALKRHSYIGSKILTRNREATVYAGFREPLFQVVVWGANPEKPSRVLIEFDPKRQAFDALAKFESDWAANFPPNQARPSSLDAFVRGTADHLRAFCAKLPLGAHCEVKEWTSPGGARVLRADIHLKQGPPVPKAIEYVLSPGT